MIAPGQITALVLRRVGRLLTIAKASMPECQFAAFQRAILDEFGSDRMEAELWSLFQSDCQSPRESRGRN